MKKALVLHGWGWDSENNWFPWVKKELENRWYEVHIPNLTNTRQPVLEEQISDIENLVQWFWEWDVIIGHSLGCQLALQTIHKYKLSEVTSIFVWPSYPWTTEEIWKKIIGDSYDKLVEYNNKELEFKELWNKYIVVLSEDDPYINLENAEDYYCMLENVEFLEYNDKWHFNNSAKVFELPDILEYI